MSTATERLQKAIISLRSRLADERGVYTRYQNKLQLLYPTEWKIVAPAIVAIANYYYGEIVRAKHDLADWMNGHEVHGTYADSDAVELIHDCCAELVRALEVAADAGNRYNQTKKDPIAAAPVKMEYDSAMSDVAGAMDLIPDVVKGLEEITYAER